jgi:hypothetical protein
MRASGYHENDKTELKTKSQKEQKNKKLKLTQKVARPCKQKENLTTYTQ